MLLAMPWQCHRTIWAGRGSGSSWLLLWAVPGVGCLVAHGTHAAGDLLADGAVAAEGAQQRVVNLALPGRLVRVVLHAALAVPVEPIVELRAAMKRADALAHDATSPSRS